MRYLKGFNEGFNPDDYKDYLMSNISEDKIISEDITDNFIYITYDLSEQDLKSLKRYLDTNSRFKDVVILSNNMNLFKLLILDKDFYERNKKWLYENIEWEEHILLKQMKKAAKKNPEFNFFVNDYKNARSAINLPKGYSMVKNLNPKIVEIWPQEVDSPIMMLEDDIIQIQYLLFKYLGH